MPTRLLIIEDDRNLAEILALHFEEKGFAVSLADSTAAGLQILKEQPADLLLLDQQLPDGTGLSLLTEARRLQPELPVIMMTGQHDLELAIQAIKQGAADFVHKPVKTAELQTTVERVLEARRQQQAAGQAEPAGEQSMQRELIGRSAAMLQVSKEIALAAPSEATVLITGESGTGKEVVARLIHQHSARADGPFVAVNCAAIVDSLLESELFGHEKGAFTGAENRKPGRFELAQGGTLFLDEIGELAAPLQAKLLRALQERVVERVGGSEPIAVDCRVIAATNRDLFREAAEGRFREDLIYRIKVLAIHLPPLRERLDDVPLLARALLEKNARRLGLAVPALPAASLQRLQQQPWPGNVRELENLLTQALIRARGGAITPDLLDLDGGPVPTGSASESGPLLSLDEMEAAHIQRVLDHTGGHKGHSCEILGISRPALDRKIKKYGLRLP